MRLYWSMPDAVRFVYSTELKAALTARASGDLRAEWHHLERAHILGQRWPREHNTVHWKMLLFGLRIKDGREIIGQLPRLLVGGVKSFVGSVPVGNTGGADLPPLRTLPLPQDLAPVLEGL